MIFAAARNPGKSQSFKLSKSEVIRTTASHRWMKVSEILLAVAWSVLDEIVLGKNT